MGSGNSSPVKQARNVETEAHQDVFELRFDHIAMGGTVFVVLMALLLVYWCQHRKKMKRLKRQVGQNDTSTPCSNCQLSQRWYPIMPPMMPTIMPPMMNAMEMFPPRHTRHDNARFTEIDETTARRPPSAPPARPQPPRGLPSPPQHRAASQTP